MSAVCFSQLAVRFSRPALTSSAFTRRLVQLSLRLFTLKQERTDVPRELCYLSSSSVSGSRGEQVSITDSAQLSVISPRLEGKEARLCILEKKWFPVM